MFSHSECPVGVERAVSIYANSNKFVNGNDTGMMRRVMPRIKREGERRHFVTEGEHLRLATSVDC